MRSDGRIVGSVGAGFGHTSFGEDGTDGGVLWCTSGRGDGVSLLCWVEVTQKMLKPWFAVLTLAVTTGAVVGLILWQNAPLVIAIPTSKLFWMQLALLVIIFVGMPLLSSHLRRQMESDEEKAHDAGRRAFNLPRGSIRAMLALFSIGSFVNVLALGPGVIPDAYFDQVVTAFGTLSGTILGFYFGGRTANPPPPGGTPGG